jgi:hypothetical protein
MKTTIISKLLLTLGLVFVLGSAITHSPALGQTLTIHSTGDVTRGETGLFVVNVNPPWVPPGWVTFSVSGTAIPGVDYVPLVPVVLFQSHPCGPSNCYAGRISVETLADPRASFFPQAYSVVVKLKPGLGYTIGEPSSAQIMINP